MLSLTARWQRQVAANYARVEPPWLVRLHQPIARALVEVLGVGPGDRVLDVAAGTGSAAEIVGAAGADVVAIDRSVHQVRVGAAALPTVRWVLAAAEALPFADNAFSHVVSNLGMVYSPAPARVLREVRRVLVPGGALAFSTHDPAGFDTAAAALLNHHAGAGAAVPAGVRQWDRPDIRMTTRPCTVHEDHASLDEFWEYSTRARRHVRHLARSLPPNRLAVLRHEYLDLAARHAESGTLGFRLTHRYLLRLAYR